MILSDIQMKMVIEAVSTEYLNISAFASISENKELQMKGKSYQTASWVNNSVRVLFVLFDSDDHNEQKEIVKLLCKNYRNDIGHTVHYQFINDNFIGINLSREIT